MDDQAKQAWVTSLRLLTATPKTRKELAKKLADKGYPEPLVSSTLDELEKKGLLSDRAYAQNMVARLTHEKPSGRRKIGFELKRHGVPPKIQEEILEAMNPEEEIQRAKEMAQLKWSQFSRLMLEKRQKRVYDFLIRRGFDFQIARDVIEELEHCD